MVGQGNFFAAPINRIVMKVIAFGAHPDDPDIGCGGSLILHSRAGDEIVLVYATDGAAGAIDIEKDELAAMRRGEAERSARILGAEKILFLPYPDGQLGFAGYGLIVELGRIIRAERPDLVYTHNPDDSHTDHRALAQASIEACRRAATPYFQELGEERHAVKEIRLYEVWTPLPDFMHAVDITDVAERKAEAIREHVTQIKRIPYDEIALGLNRYRSVMIRKSRYAEVFATTRAVW
jgi:N-acetylglucosamine malate deacetylase 1